MTTTIDYEIYFETDEARPVQAWCDEAFVYAALADGRQIKTPIRWYPFLEKASPDIRSMIELQHCGIWWPEMDEGISIRSMLLGWNISRSSHREVGRSE